jgi:hypothetical protein
MPTGLMSDINGRHRLILNLGKFSSGVPFHSSKRVSGSLERLRNFDGFFWNSAGESGPRLVGNSVRPNGITRKV